jgi:hypothetical protein
MRKRSVFGKRGIWQGSKPGAERDANLLAPIAYEHDCANQWDGRGATLAKCGIWQGCQAPTLYGADQGPLTLIADLAWVARVAVNRGIMAAITLRATDET